MCGGRTTATRCRTASPVATGASMPQFGLLFILVMSSIAQMQG
jgi:hypothetical protein